MSDKDADGVIRQVGGQIGLAFAWGKRLLRQFGSSAGLDDRERAVLEAGKNLKVEAVKKSNVIQIAYQGPTPSSVKRWWPSSSIPTSMNTSG